MLGRVADRSSSAASAGPARLTSAAPPRDDDLAATQQTLGALEADLDALLAQLREAAEREAALRRQLQDAARQISERDELLAGVSRDNENLDAAWRETQEALGERDRRAAALAGEVAELAAGELLARERIEQMQATRAWRLGAAAHRWRSRLRRRRS